MSRNKAPFIARGNQRFNIMRSKTYNIDNGSGTTDDDQLGNLPFDCYLVDVRAVYTEATDTTGAASANFKLGVTAGGATLVAATALEAAKAIGGTTTATIAAAVLPANTTLWARHTGVATTEVGQYYVQAIVMPKP